MIFFQYSCSLLCNTRHVNMIRKCGEKNCVLNLIEVSLSLSLQVINKSANQQPEEKKNKVNRYQNIFKTTRVVNKMRKICKELFRIPSNEAHRRSRYQTIKTFTTKNKEKNNVNVNFFFLISPSKITMFTDDQSNFYHFEVKVIRA